MFGLLKNKLAGAASRFSGRTDLLEATCAACALVAAADGDIEDEEVEATLNALLNHSTISAAFRTSEIEKCANDMLRRAKGGMAGRLGLYREIEQAIPKSTAEDLEMILVIAMDVSASDGQMEPEEKKVLEKIAKTLGLSLSAFTDV